MLTATQTTPIGPVLISVQHNAITEVRLNASQEVPKNQESSQPTEAKLLAQAFIQLHEYFAGARQVFDLPLQPVGTPFQRKVWQALQTIPFGQTWTYSQLAKAIDRPTAQRAVGNANGRNPLPIIVPCHRVIAANGSLGGYSSGLSIKRQLLLLEGVQY